MDIVPFPQRFGTGNDVSIEDDFTKSARIALAHLLDRLGKSGWITGNNELFEELLRTGRFTHQEYMYNHEFPLFDLLIEPLNELPWEKVYVFCERVYLMVLAPEYSSDFSDPGEIISLGEVQQFFTKELNTILMEENIAYNFLDGEFQRRGRAQTQKSFYRMGRVLTDPSLKKVLVHYNKAKEFFSKKPEADAENCVKEAVCALEACLVIKTKAKTSSDFKKIVKQHKGKEPKQIPWPIAEGMLKLHAYRGGGEGVAHANIEGLRVEELDAELVLNLVASYCTYIVDLFMKQEEDIPF